MGNKESKEAVADVPVDDKHADEQKEEKEEVVIKAGPTGRLFLAAKIGDLDGIRQAIADKADVKSHDLGPLENDREPEELDASGKPKKKLSKKEQKEQEKRQLAYRDFVPTHDTALHYAVEGGHIEAANLLFQLGADTESKNAIGSTPLHRAASSGSVACVKLLLSWGARPTAQNEIGNTPLHCAAILGHQEVCLVLLKSEKDQYRRLLNMQNHAGLRAIDYARKVSLQKLLTEFHPGMELPPSSSSLDAHEVKSAAPAAAAAASSNKPAEVASKPAEVEVVIRQQAETRSERSHSISVSTVRWVDFDE